MSPSILCMWRFLETTFAVISVTHSCYSVFTDLDTSKIMHFGYI